LPELWAPIQVEADSPCLLSRIFGTAHWALIEVVVPYQLYPPNPVKGVLGMGMPEVPEFVGPGTAFVVATERAAPPATRHIRPVSRVQGTQFDRVPICAA
jgi:hypothetical protein